MRQLLIAIPVCVVFLGAGYLHGVVTDRWTPPSAADGAGHAAHRVPMTLGDWKGEPLARQAGDNHKTTVINRKYVNSMNGRWLLTSVTSGRPGIVSVHNPEDCYLGSGYKLVDTIRAETLTLADGTEARFWTGHFQKKRPSGIESIRIYWGWSAGKVWEAPNYPRLLYAVKPRLHKLYMIHPVPVDGERDNSAAYREIMTQYVQSLSQQLGE